MIDTATIESYMRDANPIPHVDNLDPDEFAAFVAAATTRRAAAMQAPTQHPTTPPPLRRRRAWAFAAAFILILASIGIAALALRSGSAPVTDQPMPPTTTTETQTTMASEIDVKSLTWSRVPHDEAVFDDEGNVAAGANETHVAIHDVTAGGPGLVAVGEAGGDAAVWTSPDGYTWSRVPHDESTFGGTYNSRMTSITKGGPGLVAVGVSDQHFPTLPDGDYTGPDLADLGVEIRLGGSAVWTSTDGYSWSRIDLFEGSPTGGMHYVTGGGPGLIAIGSESADAAVYISVDGITWDLVDKSNYFDGAPIDAVVVGGPGLVAVGSGWDAGSAYTSPDGITWSRSLLPLDETHGDVMGVGTRGITVGGPGFVAVGRALFDTDGNEEYEEYAVVWTSPDGNAWSSVPLDEEQFAGVEMTSVAAMEAGLVAVGGSDEGVAVWMSPDGITWSRVPLDEGVVGGHMNSVTVGGPGLVAVGSFNVATGHDDPDFRSVAAVWIAEFQD